MMAHRFDLRRKSWFSMLWLVLPDQTPRYFQRALGVGLLILASAQLKTLPLTRWSSVTEQIQGQFSRVVQESRPVEAPLIVERANPAVEEPTRTLTEVVPNTSLAPAELRAPASAEAHEPSAIAEKRELTLPQGKFFRSKALENGYEISLPSGRYFAPGTADLLPEARVKLGKILEEVERDGAPGGWKSRQLTVESHTDSTPVRKNVARYETNWELSGVRSFAVVRLFEQKGVPAARMAGVGYGHGRPLTKEKDDLSRKRNRRLVIRVQVSPQEK